MKIFLIGLAGSGKSTLGAELATALGVQFIDIDKEIEKEVGMSVARIFREISEDYFREVETRLLRKWSHGDADFVLAMGGGTPCFFDNMDVIDKAGTTIFLDVPLTVLAERLIKSPQKELRPLLADTTPETLPLKLGQQLEKRIPFFRRAHITVTGDAITAAQLLTSIKKEIRK